MYCENCGQKLNKNDQFCEHCGSKNITAEDTSTTKIKKRLFLKSMIVVLITAIVLGLAFIIFSLVRPDSKYSYRNFFVDSKTHTYQQSQIFQYGPYDFQVKSSVEDIKYYPEDCSARPDAVSGRVRLFDKDYCESANLKRKNNSENKKYLTITSDIKNNSSNIHSLDTSWFKLKDSNGKEYSGFRKDFETNDILPDQKRVGTFSEIMIDKNLNEINLIISLPNSASQVVNLEF